MRYPQNNKYIQTNRSDILGTLMGSFNIDLTKVLGKIRSTRMLQTTTQTTNTNLTDHPVGFKVFNDGSATKIWTVAGADAHASASAVANAVFSVDSTTGHPTDCDSTLSDIEVMTLGSTLTLCITANSKLYVRSTGNWSSTGFTGAGPWMMTGYASRLYFTVSGLSKIYSTSDGTTIIAPNGPPNTNAYSLQLDANFRPTFIRAASNRIWIGTLATNGKGYIFEWDGAAVQATRSYRLEAQGALACVIKDDIPWIVDTNGCLMMYSGGTFKEVARLPINEKLLLRATNTLNNRFIHPNGMSIVDGRINILINNEIADSSSSTPEFCPSGVWEYDENIGLYHKASLSYTPISTTTITDYGQERIYSPGALADMKLTNNATNANGAFIAGAKIYTDASSTTCGIFTNDTVTALTGTTVSTLRSSYIVTEKIYSNSIQESWQKVFPYYRQLLSSSDSINIKYRTTEIDPTEISITWTSTSTFTTTTNVLAKEGYEVEITQGTGSGKTAHITRIDVTGSTYTVTTDDTFTGATGTAKARLQNWTKIANGVTDQASQFSEFPVGAISRWIQFKICMIFIGKDEFDGMEIINQSAQLTQ